MLEVSCCHANFFMWFILHWISSFSNIAHCYNLKKSFKEALNYGFKAIEADSSFYRGYIRVQESFICLEEKVMAVLVLMKGKENVNKELQTVKEALTKMNKEAKAEANDFIENSSYRSAKDLDLRKLFKEGLHPGPRKGHNEPAPSGFLPGLVASSSDDDSDYNSDDDDDNSTAGPRKKPRASSATRKKPRPRKDDDSGNSSLSPKAAKVVKETKAKTPPAPAPAVKKQEERPRKQEAKMPEEAKPKPPNVPQDVNPTLEKFNQLQVEGSNCFRQDTLQQSKEKFGDCINLIQTCYENLKFTKPRKHCEEVVVIKYLYARACTGLDSYKDVINGHEKLLDILESHKNVKFPAVYLGFALVFKKLNRYDEALGYAVKGVEWFENNLPCVTHSYPGLSAEPIKETKEDFLKGRFEELKQEFKCPPRPDAVCKYSDCLDINKDSHIIPSEKIFKNDPDFKPYYKVYCNSNCALDYHESCWAKLKTDLAEIKSRLTEQDFFGKSCLTPDCEGVIIKIQIIDIDQDRTFEDKKLLERLEKEELAKKEAEKLRREEENKKLLAAKKMESKAKKQKKQRTRSVASSEKDDDLSSKGDSSSNLETKINNNEDLEINNYVDTRNFNPETVTILKKTKDDTNEEDIKKKSKKIKEKNVLSLDQFNGTPTKPDQRIERLAQMKKTHENYNPMFANGMSNGGVFTHSSTSRLEQQMDAHLNPTARPFNPVSKERLPQEVIEDSVRTFFHQKLTTLGPMKDDDKRLFSGLDSNGLKIVEESGGLNSFLKADNDQRFGSYDNYICLKGDAEKAKKLKDEEEKNPGEKVPKDLGSIARMIKLQMAKDRELNGEEFGLAEAAKAPSLLDSIMKQTQEASASLLPSLPIKNVTYTTEGVQTDVSSLDLEEFDDPIQLKQTNYSLTLESQDLRDRLSKVQNEKKLEHREFTEKIEALTQKNGELKMQVEEFKEGIAKRETMFREASKKEKELKTVKEQLEAKQRETVRLESLNLDLEKKLEAEKKVSFKQNLALQKTTEKDNTIKILKLKCLKVDYDAKKAMLTQKRTDNEQLIDNLSKLFGSDANEASKAAVRAAIEKLNSYSASIFMALEQLGQNYEDRKRALETAPNSMVTEVMVDLAFLDTHTLDNVELDTLRLLTTANYNSGASRPPAATSPFSQPPPSVNRPPPGLGAAGAILGAAGGSTSRNSPLPMPGAAPFSSKPPAAAPAPVSRPPPTTTAPPPQARPPPSASPKAAQPRPPPPPAAIPRGAAAAAPPPSGPPPPPGAGAKPKKKANEKLIKQITERYPHLTDDQADGYIQQLRTHNNGKLSGMSIPKILEGVARLMATQQQGGAGGVGREEDRDRQNECSICLDTEYGPMKSLPCRHRFHTHCIDVSNWILLFYVLNIGP